MTNDTAVNFGAGSSSGGLRVTVTTAGARSTEDIVHEQCDCAARFIGQLALQQQLLRTENAPAKLNARTAIRNAAKLLRTSES